MTLVLAPFLQCFCPSPNCCKKVYGNLLAALIPENEFDTHSVLLLGPFAWSVIDEFYLLRCFVSHGFGPPLCSVLQMVSYWKSSLPSTLVGSDDTSPRLSY